MFPVYGWECLSRKAVHIWDEKRGKRFAEDEDVETEVLESGFDALVKRWDKCTIVVGGYVEK
jgi:hypothetical protein